MEIKNWQDFLNSPAESYKKLAETAMPEEKKN